MPLAGAPALPPPARAAAPNVLAPALPLPALQGTARWLPPRASTAGAGPILRPSAPRAALCTPTTACSSVPRLSSGRRAASGAGSAPRSAGPSRASPEPADAPAAHHALPPPAITSALSVPTASVPCLKVLVTLWLRPGAQSSFLLLSRLILSVPMAHCGRIVERPPRLCPAPCILCVYMVSCTPRTCPSPLSSYPCTAPL